MRVVLAGALGEVGASLHRAFKALGHDVLPVSARPATQGAVVCLSVQEAQSELAGGSVDLLVNAAGPGDHRRIERETLSTVRLLGQAAGEAGIPAILISTLRVCEGESGSLQDDLPPSPLTSYALANAQQEDVWLEYPTAVVLRMANYFCAPSSADSPQTHLLPWSLLIEGWKTSHISVRSGRDVTKEFVSDQDVAKALLLLAQDAPTGRRIATLPGLLLSLDQIAAEAQSVLAEFGKSVSSSFGVDSRHPVLAASSGWLAERGWVSTCSAAAMHEIMHGWLVEWGSHLAVGGEGR